MNTKISQLINTVVVLERIEDLGNGHVFANQPSLVRSAQAIDGLTYEGEWVGLNGWDGTIKDGEGNVVASLMPVDDPNQKFWSVEDHAPDWLKSLDEWGNEYKKAKAEQRRRDDEEVLYQEIADGIANLHRLRDCYSGTRFGKHVAKVRPDLVGHLGSFKRYAVAY